MAASRANSRRAACRRCARSVDLRRRRAGYSCTARPYFPTQTTGKGKKGSFLAARPRRDEEGLLFAAVELIECAECHVTGNAHPCRLYTKSSTSLQAMSYIVCNMCPACVDVYQLSLIIIIIVGVYKQNHRTEMFVIAFRHHAHMQKY